MHGPTGTGRIGVQRSTVRCGAAVDVCFRLAPGCGDEHEQHRQRERPPLRNRSSHGFSISRCPHFDFDYHTRLLPESLPILVARSVRKVLRWALISLAVVIAVLTLPAAVVSVLGISISAAPWRASIAHAASQAL